MCCFGFLTKLPSGGYYVENVTHDLLRMSSTPTPMANLELTIVAPNKRTAVQQLVYVLSCYVSENLTNRPLDHRLLSVGAVAVCLFSAQRALALERWVY